MDRALVRVLPDEPLGVISPLLHGHFIEHLGRCCNEGLWVGPESRIPNRGGFRADVLDLLAHLGLPVLRWPGGCYADTYHWRDGIGPYDRRPRTLGESCGLSVVEDNGFGTHEFIALCREVGAQPYLAGNVGSGSPAELMDWAHYCNGSLDTTLVRERAANRHPRPMGVRYWGVGNENWGCGGNYDPEDYAKEFRRFATFLRMADSEAELICCGDNKREWNLRVVETLKDDLKYLDHLSVHQYYKAGPATGFSEEDHYRLMRAGDLVEEDIRFTDEILRYFTAGRRKVGIAFDEWGAWHPEARKDSLLEAPNTLRDAVAAAGVLDVFHRWCGSLSMANLAQTVNVLQCLVQTDEDRAWVTPTYHLFDLYKPHRGGTALRCVVESASVDAGPLDHLTAGSVTLLSAAASTSGGRTFLTLSNRSYSEPLEVRVAGLKGGRIRTLTGRSPDSVNSADAPEAVSIVERDLDGGDTLLLAPCSVNTISMD